MRAISILIADDHVVFRMGLRTLIESQEDMSLSGEATTGLEAVRMHRDLEPDIVLIDLRMPLMGGIDAITTLRRERPDVKVLVLSSYASQEEIYRAIRAGAQGYLLKDSTREEINAAIRAVAAGRQSIPPIIAERLAERGQQSELTQREIEVLRLLIKGLMNKEIGTVLDMSESTVKTHLKKIFSKLEVSDRAEAVSSALQRGIVPLED